MAFNANTDSHLNKKILNDLSYRTDIDDLLEDIASKEPLITPSKFEQVRRLIASILQTDYACQPYP